MRLRRWTGRRTNIFRYQPLRHDLLRDRIWSEAAAFDVRAEMTGLSPLVHARPNPTNSTASRLRNIHVLCPYINIRSANQMPCRYSFLCFLTKFSQISICIFSRWFYSLFDHTGDLHRLKTACRTSFYNGGCGSVIYSVHLASLNHYCHLIPLLVNSLMNYANYPFFNEWNIYFAISTNIKICPGCKHIWN